MPLRGGVSLGSRRLRLRSALSAVVPVALTIEAAERVIPARLSVDLDEHDHSRLPRLVHPDGGRHGPRAEVDALPHAAGRRQIPPARRRLTLAFVEAILRERTHDVLDVLGGGAPPVLRFDPGPPALRAKLIEAVHGFHRVSPLVWGADRGIGG